MHDRRHRIRRMSFSFAPLAAVAALFFAASPAPTPKPQAESPSEAALQKFGEQKWTGDLDGMLKRRQIRVLVPYSKTLYFVDKGQPRGLAHDVFKLFEEDLNKHLKKGHVKVHVVFKPSARGDLIKELQEGYGDVAMAIPHHHSRATEGNRLHEPDGQGRLGDRRHDGRPAAAELPAGPLRPGGLPPQGILVLRERRETQRRAQEGRQASREDPHRAGQPGGRGHSRDGQRRTGDGDGRRRDAREVLEAGLHEDRAPSPGGGPHGGRDGLDDPQEQPAAEEGARRIHRPLSGRLLDAESAPQQVPEEHEVGEERDVRRGARQVQRSRQVLREVQQAVRHGHAPDGRPGLPGVAPRPGRQEPGRRGRRHAGDAGHGQGAQRRRHPPGRSQHPRRGSSTSGSCSTSTTATSPWTP